MGTKARRIAIVALVAATVLLAIFWVDVSKAWRAFPLLGFSNVSAYFASIAFLAVDLYSKGGE